MSEDHKSARVSVTLQPPSPYLEYSGDKARIPWAQWRSDWETYFIGADLVQVPELRQRAILLCCIGTEARRQAQGGERSKEESYKETLERLDVLFEPKKSTISRRFELSQRSQLAGESLAKFAAEVRALAAKCNFQSLAGEMARDRFIFGISELRMREKLLDEASLNPNMDLDRALEIAQSMQMTLKEAQSFRKSGSSMADSDVNAVSRPCQNCGRRHVYGDCKAKGQACRNCGRLNHFARQCRAKSDIRNSNVTKKKFFRGQQNLVLEEDSDDFIFAIEGKQDRGPFHVKLRLESKPMRLMVDPGATFSLLNVDTVDSLGLTGSIRPTSANLTAYGGGKISLEGEVDVCVGSITRDQTLTQTFYVATSGRDLMGRDLFKRLGFSISGPDGQINAVDAKMQQRLKDLTGFRVVRCFQHKLKIDPNVELVQQQLRRQPLSLRERIAEQVRMWVQEGIVEEITASPSVSNLHAVPKPNGDLRVTLDMKIPNKAIIADVYPLPTRQELTSKMAGATIFSKLDLKNGYLQIPLHPESRFMTAFVCDIGLFQFKRVPFGVTSAPCAFQRILECALKGLDGVFNSLDDIIIFGDESNHDDRLSAVLDRLEKFNFGINGQKSEIRKDAVNFLGFCISRDGIIPLFSNVQAIEKVASPTNVKELQSFLGMTVFYAELIPRYADLTAPLRKLLKANTPWQWGKDQIDAVSKLKKCVTSAPVLSFFDCSKTTVLTTDASRQALGAVLSQPDVDGVQRPVAFVSRALRGAEFNYSATELEALAALWAMERLDFYLYGRSFILRSDHSALKSLLGVKGAGVRPMRISRWIDRFQRYNFDVEFTPGKENSVADFLSRFLPASREEVDISAVDCDEDEILLVHDVDWDIEELKSATSADEELQLIRKYTRDGWPKDVSASLKRFLEVRHEIWEHDGIVRRGFAVLVPSGLRNKVLAKYHDQNCHLGITRFKDAIRQVIWWPKINSDVENFVKSCSLCQLSGKSKKPVPPPLVHETPPEPWTEIQIDIKGPINWWDGMRYFVVMLVDKGSRWPEASFHSHVSVDEVILLLDESFCRYGVVRKITSDNGPQFRSEKFAEFCRRNNVNHARAAVYNPQTDGMIERLNRTLGDSLRIGSMKKEKFDGCLRKFLFSYRFAKNATGTVPAEIFLKRKIQLPLNFWAKFDKKRSEDYEKLNQKCNAKNLDVDIGQNVLVKNESVSKNDPKFDDGWKVIEKKGEKALRLKKGEKEKTTNVRKCFVDLSAGYEAKQPLIDNDNFDLYDDVDVRVGSTSRGDDYVTSSGRVSLPPDRFI